MALRANFAETKQTREVLLRRLGNKQRNAAKYLPLMPPHRIYFETFFGAGGMFFNKPLADYSYLNDLDGDVYNLFRVVLERADELAAKIANPQGRREPFEALPATTATATPAAIRIPGTMKTR